MKSILFLMTAVFLSCSLQKGTAQSDKILDLSGRGLTKISEKIIEKNKNVESLILSDNKFTEFPKSIFEFENLKSLGLKNNNLMSIPSEISNLTELESLDLRGTKINHLPSVLKRMHNLKLVLMFEVDLTENQRNEIKCVLPIGCEVMFSKEYREYPPYDCVDEN